MYVAIYTTFQNESEAKKFGKLLTEEHLAACINIFPGIVSIYRWNDTVQEDKEVVVWIKTRKSLVEKIHDKLKENHSYDIPAFVVYQIHSGSEEYLQWIKTETDEY